MKDENFTLPAGRRVYRTAPANIQSREEMIIWRADSLKGGMESSQPRTSIGFFLKMLPRRYAATGSTSSRPSGLVEENGMCSHSGEATGKAKNKTLAMKNKPSQRVNE